MAKVKTTLTPELIDQLEELILSGNYAQTSAEALGIPYDSFNNWMQTGEELWVEGQQTGQFATAGDPLALRVELYLRLKQSAAQWQVKIVERLESRIRNGHYWQGDMTFLERRDPSNWGRREVPTRMGKSWEEAVREWTREGERKRARAEKSEAGSGD